MEIDAMDSEGELAFLLALKAKHPDKHVVVVWDNAPCHRRKDLHSISGLTLIALPSYSPELNPAERFFEEIRRATCDTIFETLPKIEETIAVAVNRWSDDIAAMKELLGYEWIVKQWGDVN
jgi:transposase